MNKKKSTSFISSGKSTFFGTPTENRIMSNLCPWTSMTSKTALRAITIGARKSPIAAVFIFLPFFIDGFRGRQLRGLFFLLKSPIAAVFDKSKKKG